MTERFDGASSTLGFFDQSSHLDQTPVVFADFQDAVAVRVFLRHLGNGDDAAAGFIIGVGQLLQARRFGQDEVVGQQNGERIVADEGAGAPYGVAEAKRLLLAHRDQVAWRNLVGMQHFQLGIPAALAQGRLQFEGDVEILDERRFAAAGDQAELLDARRPRLFHGVLDQRLVHDGQHFLGHRLGGRQEPRSQPGDGQNRLGKLLDHAKPRCDAATCPTGRPRSSGPGPAVTCLCDDGCIR